MYCRLAAIAGRHRSVTSVVLAISRPGELRARGSAAYAARMQAIAAGQSSTCSVSSADRKIMAFFRSAEPRFVIAARRAFIRSCGFVGVLRHGGNRVAADEVFLVRRH